MITSSINGSILTISSDECKTIDVHIKFKLTRAEVTQYHKRPKKICNNGNFRQPFNDIREYFTENWVREYWYNSYQDNLRYLEQCKMLKKFANHRGQP